MARMSLVVALALAVSVSVVVFLLGLLARVTLGTLLVRTVSSFLVLGVLGAILGSILEVMLVPQVTGQEQEKVRSEMDVSGSPAVANLGDLLAAEPAPEGSPDSRPEKAGQAGGFVPMSFPRAQEMSAGPAPVPGDGAPR